MILRAVAEPGSAGAVEQLGEFADVTDADHYVQVNKFKFARSDGPLTHHFDFWGNVACLHAP